MEALDLIRKNPFFKAVSEEVVERLARQCEVKQYASSEIVVREGSPQVHILLICSGQMELYRRNREADTQMLVGLIEPPAIFGDAELYSGEGKWGVSSRASDGLTLVRVPTRAFDSAVRADGDLAQALYRDACARHMLSIHIVQIFALQKTEHKILRLLWSQSHLIDGKRRAPLEPVRLARALGIDRKTIGRNLADLERRKLVIRTGEEVVLQISEEQAFWSRLGKHGLGSTWKMAELSKAVHSKQKSKVAPKR